MIYKNAKFLKHVSKSLRNTDYVKCNSNSKFSNKTFQIETQNSKRKLAQLT